MAIDKRRIFEEIETYFGAEAAAIYAATDWLKDDIAGVIARWRKSRGGGGSDQGGNERGFRRKD